MLYQKHALSKTFHLNLKFSYGKEVNNTLPFLDVFLLKT